jgi:signal peptidase II
MKARGVAVAIIVAVLVLDRITKLYIQHNFSLFDMVVVIPNVFNIVHAENPGAAFSMLADAPLAVRRAVLVLLSGAVMVTIGFMLFRNRGQLESMATVTGLALVLGGALGNFWDRVIVGTVTDFIQVFLGSYEYPSFNVADSAIFCGAVLLILDLWPGRGRRPGFKTGNSQRCASN